jgi:hypothetical protein
MVKKYTRKYRRKNKKGGGVNNCDIDIKKLKDTFVNLQNLNGFVEKLKSLNITNKDDLVQNDSKINMYKKKIISNIDGKIQSEIIPYSDLFLELTKTKTDPFDRLIHIFYIVENKIENEKKEKIYTDYYNQGCEEKKIEEVKEKISQYTEKIKDKTFFQKKKASPKKASPKKASPKKASPKKASPKKALPKIKITKSNPFYEEEKRNNPFFEEEKRNNPFFEEEKKPQIGLNASEKKQLIKSGLGLPYDISHENAPIEKIYTSTKSPERTLKRYSASSTLKVSNQPKKGIYTRKVNSAFHYNKPRAKKLAELPELEMWDDSHINELYNKPLPMSESLPMSEPSDNLFVSKTPPSYGKVAKVKRQELLEKNIENIFQSYPALKKASPKKASPKKASSPKVIKQTTNERINEMLPHLENFKFKTSPPKVQIKAPSPKTLKMWNDNSPKNRTKKNTPKPNSSELRKWALSPKRTPKRTQKNTPKPNSSELRKWAFSPNRTPPQITKKNTNERINEMLPHLEKFKFKTSPTKVTQNVAPQASLEVLPSLNELNKKTKRILATARKQQKKIEKSLKTKPREQDVSDEFWSMDSPPLTKRLSQKITPSSKPIHVIPSRASPPPPKSNTPTSLSSSFSDYSFKSSPGSIKSSRSGRSLTPITPLSSRSGSIKSSRSGRSLTPITPLSSVSSNSSSLNRSRRNYINTPRPGYLFA